MGPALPQYDLSSASPDAVQRELAAFEGRLRDWAAHTPNESRNGPGLVSIETPVFKGGWLMPCIESVINQSSPSWTFSARWDGGDELSRQVLEVVAALDHPKLDVSFGENRGIAHTRRFLTERGRGDYILTLDDDDVLAPAAVERFLACAAARPWSGIIRAMRTFIDDTGAPAGEDTWFPFMPRQYQYGMVTDPYNHSQPALISRASYERTSGWEGFPEFRSAGEDCDIFLKIEEIAPIELLPEVLYYYRISDRRTSLVITNEAAFEMWRRLVDKSIARIGLPIRRVTDRPPYVYERLPQTQPAPHMIDVIVAVRSSAKEEAGVARSAAAVRACGILPDAVTLCEYDGGWRSLNDVLQRTTRPLIWLIEAGIEPSGADTCSTLCSLIHEHGADLAAPRMVTRDGVTVGGAPGFNAQRRPVHGGGGTDGEQRREAVDVPCLMPGALLIRREVIRAVGGFDERYADPTIAAADLCLASRRRGFRCLYAGSAAVFAPPTDDRAPAAGDLEWFDAKWAASSELF